MTSYIDSGQWSQLVLFLGIYLSCFDARKYGEMKINNYKVILV